MTIDEQPDIGTEIAKASALAWKLDKRAGAPELPTEDVLAHWLETTCDGEELETANAKMLEAVHKVVGPLGLFSIWTTPTPLWMTLQSARWIPESDQVQVLVSYRAEDKDANPDLIPFSKTW